MQTISLGAIHWKLSTKTLQLQSQMIVSSPIITECIVHKRSQQHKLSSHSYLTFGVNRWEIVIFQNVKGVHRKINVPDTFNLLCRNDHRSFVYLQFRPPLLLVQCNVMGHYDSSNKMSCRVNVPYVGTGKLIGYRISKYECLVNYI